MASFQKKTQIYIIIGSIVVLIWGTVWGVFNLQSIEQKQKKVSSKRNEVVVKEDLAPYLESLSRKNSSDKDEQILSNASKSIYAGEVIPAAKSLEVLLEKEEKKPENKTGSGKLKVVAAKILLAQAYLQNGNSAYQEKEAAKKALTLLSEAVNTDDDDYGAYGKYFVGYSYEITRQYDKALFYYDKGLKVSSNTNKMKAVFTNQIGHVHQLKGDFNKAYTLYLQAYQLNPNDPSIGLNVARSMVRLKKLKESIPYFEAGIKVQNNALASEALFNLSSVYLSLEGDQKTNIENSLKYAKLSVQRYEKYPLGHVGLARAYILQNTNLDEAEKHLNIALKAYPKLSLGYEWLGILNQWKGNYNKAFDNFSLAIKVLPEDITLMKDELTTQEARLDFYIAATLSLGTDHENAMVYLNKMIALQDISSLLLLKAQIAKPDYGIFSRSKGYAPFEKMVSYFNKK